MPDDPDVSHRSTFEALLRPWQDGPVDDILDLITDDYAGHMLYLADGERTGDEYPAWIERYRANFPGTRFVIQDQFESGDRVCTRLKATRVDEGRTLSADGINISRYDGTRVAEEWAIWTAWRTT